MKILIIFSTLILSGCAGPLTVLSYYKTAADGVMWIITDKTINDHALSAATDKDCKMFRVLEDKKICIDKKNIDKKTNKSLK